MTWTATANQPWITVSPPRGSAAARLTVSIDNPPSPNRCRRRRWQRHGDGRPRSARRTRRASTVNLTMLHGRNHRAAIGVFDTPTDGQGGVTGSIPVTGWAIDDIGAIRVCRDRCRDPRRRRRRQSKIYIGDAVLRHRRAARHRRAVSDQAVLRSRGLGLSAADELPAEPGQRDVHAAWRIAEDFDGFATLLGSKTITCTNATATAPFGAIDTPGQGGTASGAAFVNFGWALAGQPTGTVHPDRRIDDPGVRRLGADRHGRFVQQRARRIFRRCSPATRTPTARSA